MTRAYVRRKGSNRRRLKWRRASARVRALPIWVLGAFIVFVASAGLALTDEVIGVVSASRSPEPLTFLVGAPGHGALQHGQPMVFTVAIWRADQNQVVCASTGWETAAAVRYYAAGAASPIFLSSGATYLGYADPAIPLPESGVIPAGEVFVPQVPFGANDWRSLGGYPAREISTNMPNVRVFEPDDEVVGTEGDAGDLVYATSCYWVTDVAHVQTGVGSVAYVYSWGDSSRDTVAGKSNPYTADVTMQVTADENWSIASTTPGMERLADGSVQTTFPYVAEESVRVEFEQPALAATVSAARWIALVALASLVAHAASKLLGEKSSARPEA